MNTNITGNRIAGGENGQVWWRTKRHSMWEMLKGRPKGRLSMISVHVLSLTRLFDYGQVRRVSDNN